MLNDKTPVTERFNRYVEFARCPQCGDKVFIPSVHRPPNNPEDPWVWCREFGHWAGHLSDCTMKAEFILTYFNDEAFSNKLGLLSKIEAAFDDDRNNLPDSYYYFSDDLPLGTRVKVTMEVILESEPKHSTAEPSCLNIYDYYQT
jgi:hypothetical protein